MKIRTAEKEDLQQILNLFTETVQIVCAVDYSSEQLKAWVSSAENKDKWLKRIEEDYFLLAEEDSQLAGFASLRIPDYLDLLYVSKNFQRQGVGNLLTNRLESKALSLGAKSMTTHASITALPFFEKRGYSIVSPNSVIINGIELTNFEMSKNLFPEQLLLKINI